ncbi:bifunctional UDP-sugar hydrolase/5'-nucleotidase [Rothia sp. ZJ932]|uniref:bifunctional metallophosphatase/5'-nucleotidase n=1 Tax=Rothia sp. ZJ932 TaxID=2810516 RepID=UPI001967FBE5|nr:bifunctional UDP-sugar hydrolase/5'-nucleotidase [Rothia sp. ZJ932]QRZ61519.1 bifunctional metallophosphatase/5'-nucleotidase [Rothia sp. ZJ932]
MASRFKKTATAAASTLTLLVLPLATPAHAEGTSELQILNINDFHGRINNSIGMGLAATVQQQRAENPNSLLLSAGDNVGASLFVSSISDDEATLDYLNALGLQASAVGNHEFDRGLADLINRIAPKSNFPQLGANVVDTVTNKPALDPYVVLTAPDGTKVAVIGAVTVETPQLTDPSALGSVRFENPVDAVNKYAAQLSDGDEANGEADIVIAEYHEGVDTANPNADAIVSQTSADVDAIFTGHTHAEYVLEGKIPGSAKTRPVVQTGNYGDNLGKVVLTLDENKNVISHTAELVGRAKAPSDEVVAADPVLTRVQEILTKANDYATEVGQRKLATLEAPITTGWDAGKAENRGGFDQRDRESTMGHLIADMYLSAANSTGRTPADIGIVNPGGLRDEFPGGLRSSLETPLTDITLAQAVGVTPFANNLWTTELTGAQLKQVLEEQWQTTDAERTSPASRSYLQLGFSNNLTYTFTGERGEAGLATADRNIAEIFVNGKKVADDQKITVAIPSFLLGGGDNFRTLAQGTNSRDTALVDSDAFQTYLSEQKNVAPRFNKQAVKVSGVAESYDVAGNLTFTASELNVASFGAPTVENLMVSVDGVELGAVAVTDGAAAINLPLAGKVTAGERLVTLKDAATGTTANISVLFTGEVAPQPSDDESKKPAVPAPVDSPEVTKPADEAKSDDKKSDEAKTDASPSPSTAAVNTSQNSGSQGSTAQTQQTQKPLANTGFGALPLAMAGVALVVVGGVLMARRKTL